MLRVLLFFFVFFISICTRLIEGANTQTRKQSTKQDEPINHVVLCLTILCLQCVLSELVSNWCTFVCIYRLSVCVLDCIGWLSLSCKYTTNGFLYISTIYETRFFISLLIRFLFVSIKTVDEYTYEYLLLRTLTSFTFAISTRWIKFKTIEISLKK